MFKRMARLLLGVFGVEVRNTGEGLLLARARRRSGTQRAGLLAAKFSAADIKESLVRLRERWADHSVVLLTDGQFAPFDGVQAEIRCGHDPASRIGEFDLLRTVFLYACDSDDVGLPYVREIIFRRGTFYPIQIYTPSSYAHINHLAREVAGSESERQRREGFDKFDFGLGDSLNLMQAISVTAHLAGDYVEIGCFRGSSACIALSYLRESGAARNCYFLDVFEGFTYQAARDSADAMWAETHGTEGQPIVANRIASRGSPELGLNAIVLKNNVVEDPLPSSIGDIVLANVDVDLYEAVVAALFKVAPRIVPGGIIIVEDPGHTPALIGSRLALQEFLDSPASTHFVPIYLESGQTFLVRTAGQPEEGAKLPQFS
jgi:hypothetical protein